MPAEDYNQIDTTEKKDTATIEAEKVSTRNSSILRQSIQQLEESRKFKKARFEQIKENENLYHGIIKKSISNPFNESFPYMAGFVDHLKSKIDDDSNLLFINQAEADFKKTQKINAFYEQVSKSSAPCDSWSVKHRYAKYNAMFSGVAIYKYYTAGAPYKSYLEVISHYDFHCEPRGGGILENHLFCGQDNIYKNLEDLTNDNYNQVNAKKLITWLENQEHKDQSNTETNRDNRAEALNQQPEQYNYVGQSTIKLVEWYTTFKNVRYYVLFHESSVTYLRCIPLVEMFPKNWYPYITWHTNEDDSLFWGKAPCDDARPIANNINTFINQELYNRQKRNYGQRAYDPEMFPNLAALANWRPDGMIPFDSKNGTRNITQGFYELKVGDLNGTLDLVTWLESFTGKQIGNTSSSQGQSDKDKKATVFLGEIRQVEQLIGIKNKSYTDALSRLGMLFKQGMEMHLDAETSVKVMGGKGIEWQTITPKDLETEQDLLIQPIGGTSDLEIKKIKDQAKLAVLSSQIIKTINPQWRERQMLLLQGFTEAEVKEAFSAESFAEKELMSEAAEAEKQIVEGKTPPLNKGANANFMQHILDFAQSTNTGDIGEMPTKIYNTLLAYATAHTDIVIENMQRDIKKQLADRAKMKLSTGLPVDNNSGTMLSNDNPTGRNNTQNQSTPGEVPIA